MRFSTIACLLTAAYLTTAVSAPAIFTGRIIDKASKPIVDATISLKIKGTFAKSDATGAFSLPTVGVIASNSGSGFSRSLFINGQNLLFTNEIPLQLKVELFDMNGKRVSAVLNRLFSEGSFSLPIFSLIMQQSANGLYIARITRGNEIHTLPLSPLCSIKPASLPAGGKKEVLAKRLATPDSLIVSKQNYVTFSRAIDSDVAQDVGNITLNLINDPDSAIEKKVDSLLALMTIDEKIAQTAEVLVNVTSTNDLKTNMYGSLFNGGGYPFSSNDKTTWKNNLDGFHDAAKQSRLGIPILYGIDAVHGLGTIEGATVFPHNIGMGCTGDTALVAKMANITAKECRALGINLNFGPAISVVRNEKWGRTYEGFGETPEINSLMAAAYVRGLQGNGDLTRPDAVAACAKHFIGDGGTTDGVNGGVTNLSEETMKAVHLPPYRAAVSERVASIMPSYNAWSRNGQAYRCTNDQYSLTDLLKNGLKWNGFCLSDWDAIPRAVAATAETELYTAENVSKAVAAGIDMAMIAMNYDPAARSKKVTDYIASLKQSVPGTVSQSRLDDAVKRILRIKFRLDLFSNAKSNASYFSEFGSAEHRAVARECVRKSLVLLKNEGSALPLKKTEKVAVVGPWAKSLGTQCGGWTISWQGAVDNPTIVGTTILKGLQDLGGSTNVVYDETGNNLSNYDKIVLVIGEPPYSEGAGDHGITGSASNICPVCNLYNNSKISIILSDCPNRDLLAKCFSVDKPVIVVLISGRPLIITPEIAKAKAFVAAWLPGSEGAGVAEVLYNENGANFIGKLTHTWPSTIEQIPINTGTAYTDEQHGSGGDPLFPYGFGLTY